MLVARLSFSGERAYEVYCGSDHALAVWERLLEAGAEFDVMPYGLEALGTLRIEKGHVTGAEIDGRTSVHDLGLEKMFSMKKDFVGKPLALRPALTDPGRKQLVGLKIARRQAGAASARIWSPAPTRRSRAAAEGHVTAMCYSPALEGYIALALLERGRQRHGEKLLRRRSAARRARPGGDRRSLLLRQGREPHAWLTGFPPSRMQLPPSSAGAADACSVGDPAPGSIVQVAGLAGDAAALCRRIIDELLGVEAAEPVGHARPAWRRDRRRDRARPLS